MKYFVLISLSLLFALPLLAGDSDDKLPRKMAQAGKEKPGQGKPSQGKAAQIDPKAEGDVLEFVREHHPELAELLSQLKEHHPKEYQKAVQDLSRVRQRLHMMKKNDDRRYELELSVWKAETRIQLLAARLHMGDSAELREQLRSAINEQVDLRLALLKHEREQAKDRMGKLDAQIKKLDTDRSQAVERQLENLTAKSVSKNAEKSDKPKPDVKKPQAKPTAKPAKDPAKKP